MILRLILSTLFLSSLCIANAPTFAATSLVIYWNRVALEVIQSEHSGPTEAARALAMVHTCAYNAWAVYTPTLRLIIPDTPELRRPGSEATPDNKQKAISYAAYRCLADLFPRRRASLREKLHAVGYDPDDTSADLATPSGIGNVIAQAVIDACHHDGANQLGDLSPGEYEDYSGYRPVNGPDRLVDPDHWQPLRIVNRDQYMIQEFLTPFWGRVTTFALTSPDQFRPDPPYTWKKNREEYIQQATELVEISAHLTDREKMIAEYWSDGSGSDTPPGHWCGFAQWVAARDHLDLDAEVKLFFVLTNALFDASIATWDAKRAYDSVRPITAIHFLFSGKRIRAWGGPSKGTEEIDGAGWQPYQKPWVITPPFPEYVSGHSAFSAAAAEVLRQFTGRDAFGYSVRIKAGSSKIAPGKVPARDLTLSWPTFSAAADQAGISRRYGGIHFKNGDMNGRKLGRLVGAQAYRKAVQYFSTSDPSSSVQNDKLGLHRVSSISQPQATARRGWACRSRAARSVRSLGASALSNSERDDCPGGQACWLSPWPKRNSRMNPPCSHRVLCGVQNSPTVSQLEQGHSKSGFGPSVSDGCFQDEDPCSSPLSRFHDSIQHRIIGLLSLQCGAALGREIKIHAVLDDDIHQVGAADAITKHQLNVFERECV